MCALLVCGEVFDPNAFTQEGYLYSWLDNLLNCNDERVRKKIITRIVKEIGKKSTYIGVFKLQNALSDFISF